MIEFLKYRPLPFEVVERKGLGHPDTLADGISEAISVELSRIYLEEFGEILHHNVDKVLITAGRTEVRFGGGRVLEPPTVIVGGRATAPEGEDMEALIARVASSHLEKSVKNLKEYRVDSRVREGSPELVSLMKKGANDTSIGVGFAPLNPTEELVLDMEKKIRGVRGVGEDTKMMAVRIGDRLNLVAAAAIVSRYVTSMEDYREVKAKVREAIGEADDAEVAVNAADSDENIFLTLTGSSIEMGDDGATGRGNRGSGLITPLRPMSIEAIAGKNPVNHVGKIYNVVASRAAEEIAEIEDVKEAYVTLVSRIGAPLAEPLLRAVEIRGESQPDEKIERRIEAVLNRHLEGIGDLVEEFVAGRLRIC
ncbi:MAG: methionine adenosyltransferase [Methanothrix sp.]|jgi:S-adenosylmethionine synthetase|uniref:Methionine adenosyltransferase n=1 Tax=Methanothrix harundinacea TaxID=301375 RepID=A0A101IFV7_9EURY|nr:MAG: S-adenosylmethionine synthetase [Methanosaeta sp. SDB]KUK43451.1 MAG: Methionine adenosyltransferase [Methanothrix harundinacea]MDD2639289.1 methionine adenosyltransferase [Methanothrix sp.]KUK94514.1 MAG: Methionine adenosyltransferase [Methanothrix harundinacea]MCP1392283.1 methionine adenosyltransferase [Methanothrix harundinacea]